MKELIALLVVFTTVMFSACADARDGEGNPLSWKKNPLRQYSNAIILQWNSVAMETMQGPSYNPLLSTRIMTMVHIAMHDALNSIAPAYDTYNALKEDRKADPIAAVSAAAHFVLVQSFPDQRGQLDIAFANALRDIKAGDARERGIALGIKAGTAIVALREGDNAFADPVGQVNNPATPGLYQPTPPMPVLFAPFWKTLPTFGLNSPEQFRVGANPELSSAGYAQAFNEVKAKGAKENSTRTNEETLIAMFWYEFSEIGWNRVTAVVAADRNLDLLSAARLFALVNIALADSYIAGWDSKFHYNFWRPYTAIRAAATDGNDQTAQDAVWEPLMGTPPIHDYPSTHSVLGNAAATVLNQVVGTNVGFTMTSTSADPSQPTRTLKNFSEASRENADSRVLAGLHFRFSCDAGLKLGEDIGEWVVENHLKPKPQKNL